jgi:hypothetical protein
MRRFAVVDVGTNSVKFRVGELEFFPSLTLGLA